MPAPILVRKYGGTSIADVPRLREVARELRACREQGYQLVVVVSAMGHATDELAALARQANPDPPRRELDMLLTVGERVSMSLLCMALAAESCPALSLTGSQCGIITDASHTDARIVEVRADRVRDALAAGHVVVVAGFQGVSRTREITTLGRGGSDATAVALAAALGAERCEILKDVDGVMTADPFQVPDARRHDRLGYDDMQAIADAGCGVVHPRAVAYARDHGVTLRIASSFHAGPGTLVGAPAEPAPAEETERLRPLAINVDEDCERLRARWSRQEDGVAVLAAIAATSPPPLLAEWVELGDSGGWEAWTSCATAARIQAALAVGGATLERTADQACISLAGVRPRVLSGAIGELASWLAARSGGAAVRSDGTTVRLLVSRASLPRLPRDLHAWLLPG